MPPRKRKVVETSLESETQKRVTRSSTTRMGDATSMLQLTRPATSKSRGSKTISTKPKAETHKLLQAASSSAKDTKDTTSKSAISKESACNDPASKSDNAITPPTALSKPFSALTISSDLAKSPIQCHSYSAPADSPTLIFTHGAGGDCSAPAVTNFCTGFSNTYPILAFNGSMNLSSRTKGFHVCISHIGLDSRRLVLGGRSMGARAAVMAASEVMKDGAKREMRLVLVSYPLKGPKDVRDRILIDLPTVVKALFVIGERDAMCPLDMLEGVRKRMKAGSQLVVVKEADHGMHVRSAGKEGDREVGEETGRVVAEWVAGKVREDVMYVGGDGD